MPECRCVMGNDPAVSTQAVCDCPVHGGAGDGREESAQVPDPFTALHTGWIGVVEMFRHARHAGATMVESAVLVAAIVLVNGANQDGQAGSHGGES